MSDLARLQDIVSRTPPESVDAAAHWKGRWEFAMAIMDDHGLENWSLMKERDAYKADAERLAEFLRIAYTPEEEFDAAVVALAAHDRLIAGDTDD